MRLLIDTNIFLEILLNQTHADEAKDFLRKGDQHEFFITDFALHSIGLILLRQRKPEVFRQFLNDMIVNAGITQLSLSPLEMEQVITAATSFRLDFDDSYQYATAERYDLIIVSFDSDFDRTVRGRTLPMTIV
ncbi:MAG TPA: PIN domain-containing protein [Blastocatellia bacterium]|nr:PIN domain-containing protein [Blastocatellia bacterium]